jgi:class 3 adenylate cyclase/tetratricopeptide (TPR) repeat protein
MTEVEKLEQAIAALEAQRATLGDEVVETALTPLRKKLSALSANPATPTQRKMITILFVDVTGFTALSQTLDAEVVAETINTLWQRIDFIIHEHGGVIDKHIGDAVMALWGIEEAREDDPERAIRAALAIQATAHTGDGQFSGPLRAGINTGPVLLGKIGSTGEYTAMGDAVNLASRLESAAPPGGVLISHDTYRHVRGVFDVVPQPLLTVKGKTEPVQTYLVQRAKPRAFRMATRGVEGVETRMIGREAELLTLQNLFRAVTEGDEAHLFTVIGEAGVGKSRLLYEFDNWLELLPEQVLYFKGRATLEMMNTPYGLLRDVFRYRLGILESDNLSIVLAKFTDGLAGLTSADQACLIGHLIGFDFSAAPAVRNLLRSGQFVNEATASLIAYFQAASASSPVVVLLEDLHWADNASLDMVGELLSQLADSRLLIAATARPTFKERRPLWGEGQLAGTRLELKPLLKRDSRLLVHEILQKVGVLPEELRELIVTNAEGNPFYVEELIRILIDDEVIRPGEESWQVETGRLKEIRIPPTLTGVLQARLDGLPADERLALQRASVVGRLFWDQTVAALQAEGERQIGVAPQLEALRARELVYRREQSAFDNALEYIFKHALLRDVTYDSVLLKVRRAYHRQVADWLNAVSGERRGEYLPLVAEHYQKADAPERAGAALSEAGERALSLSLYSEAREFFSRALSLIRDEAGRCHVECLLSEACVWLSEFEAARLHAESAGADARKLDLLVEAARALNTLGQIALDQGDLARAADCLDEALALARTVRDSAVETRVLFNCGWVTWLKGDLERAEALFLDSLQLARRANDAPGILAALNGLGVTLMPGERWEESERYTQEALELACATGNRYRMVTALNNLGALADSRGDLQRLRVYNEQALALSQQLRLPKIYALLSVNMSIPEIAAGNFEAARFHLRNGAQSALKSGLTPTVVAAVMFYGCLVMSSDDRARGLAIIGAARHHPAFNTDLEQNMKQALGRHQLELGMVEDELTQGKTLDFDRLVEEVLET